MKVYIEWWSYFSCLKFAYIGTRLHDSGLFPTWQFYTFSPLITGYSASWQTYAVVTWTSLSYNNFTRDKLCNLPNCFTN
jgi:hypothetical protein